MVTLIDSEKKNGLKGLVFPPRNSVWVEGNPCNENVPTFSPGLGFEATALLREGMGPAFQYRPSTATPVVHEKTSALGGSRPHDLPPPQIAAQGPN